MSVALLFHFLMLNMFRILIHPSSGACDLFVEALVPRPAHGYHTTTAKPQPNTNTHRTRSIQPMK